MLSVAAHVVLAWAVVQSYGAWRPRQPERSLSYLLDIPAIEARPLPPLTEVLPPPPGRPQAPFAVPAAPELPPPAAALTPAPEPDSVIGVPGGRGRRGVRGALALTPRYGDGRLWAPRPMYIPEGGSRPIAMDTVVRNRLLAMADMLDSLAAWDSLSPNADRRRNPSWVIERGGRKYGIDERGIHFGTFSLPTMLLAFLPIPQGNVDQSRANQRLMEMRAEILRAAARAEAEDDFTEAVRGVRERWNREREERRERERRERERPQPAEERPRP